MGGRQSGPNTGSGGSDITGPGSRSAEGYPESSLLSAMSIVDIGLLNLVVVYPHRSCTDNRTGGASCFVSTRVLVSLPVQEVIRR